MAAQALARLRVSLDAAREQVRRLIRTDRVALDEPWQATDGVMTALEGSLTEALNSGVSYIDTEQLLLGLLRDHSDGSGYDVLYGLGIKSGLNIIDRVRSVVMELASNPQTKAATIARATHAS